MWETIAGQRGTIVVGRWWENEAKERMEGQLAFKCAQPL